MGEIFTLIVLAALINYRERPALQQATVYKKGAGNTERGGTPMKRTYVDVIGEYYDSLDDLIVDANWFGIKDVDLIRVLSGKKIPRKQSFREE